MGKTYRYDKDADEVIHVKDYRGKERKARLSEEEYPYLKEDKVDDSIPLPGDELLVGELTMDWAVNAMKKRIGRMVDFLALEGFISTGEKEDYSQEFNLIICRAVPSYRHLYDDPKVRVFAARAFLRNVLDNAMIDIRKHIVARNRRYKQIGIACTKEEFLENKGRCIWINGEETSDKYDSVKNLIVEMDKETMRGLMKGIDERLCFDLKCDGYNEKRIAEILAWKLGRKVSRYQVIRVLIKNIQEVMRKCGYLPKAEEFRKQAEA